MLPGNYRNLIRTYWTVAIYVLVTWITQASYQADTVMYIRIEQAFEAGDRSQFLDFSHMLWHPLGWLLSQFIRILPSWVAGADAFHQIASGFFFLTWISGLFAVITLIKLLRLLSISQRTSNIAGLFLIFGNAFLNFSQTGSAYVPGFTLVLLALYFLVRAEARPELRGRSIVFAGLVLGFAICVWIPYLCSAPGVLSFALLYYGYSKQRLARAFVTGAIAAGVIIVIYGAALVIYGLEPVAAFTAWNARMRDSMQGVRGISRVVFGIGKISLNMATDAIDLKRYLLHDPYNQTTLADLFLRAIWKYVLVYGMLVSLVVVLLANKRSRKVLYILAIGSAPMLYFATTFDGAASERYFPLLPFLLVAIAFAFEYKTPKNRALLFRSVLVALLLAMVSVNIPAMYSARVESHWMTAEAETKALAPYLKPQSILFSSIDDPVAIFKYEVHDYTDYAPQLKVEELIGLNSATAPVWKQRFAAKVDSAWQRGSDVLLRADYLYPKPKPESRWVEKQDPRIAWSDLYEFFRQFETVLLVAPDISIVKLPPTPTNKRLLSDYL